jgi:hypothetical protein
MQFARWVFRAAGVFGLLVLVPQYFLERRIGLDDPPPITHPEYFYGFVGVAVAWQAAFLIIGHDPARYRLLMLPAMLEKVSFGVPALLLFALRRAAAMVALFGLLDLAWGLLFAAAFWSTAPSRAGRDAAGNAGGPAPSRR